MGRTHDGTLEDLTRKLAMAEDASNGMIEVVSMRAQYFRDITEQGVESARQMSFFVEKGNDAVFSKSYRSARDALTSMMETEAAKRLTKARLERASTRHGGGVALRGLLSQSYGPLRAQSGIGGAERRPLWRKTALRAILWHQDLGASEYLVRAIRFGILDRPTMPFTEGIVLENIPQSEEKMAFGVQDLMKGCANGLYEELYEYVRDRVREGNMVSSAFTVWQREGAERKGRFVVNLKRQRKHWPRGSVKMETITGFALNLQKDDYLMSWDIKVVTGISISTRQCGICSCSDTGESTIDVSLYHLGGAIGAVVHETFAPRRAVPEGEVRVQYSPLHRRLSACAVAVFASVYGKGLCSGTWEVGSPVRKLGSDAAQDERMLGRGHTAGPSGGANRHGRDEGVHCRREEGQDDADVQGAVATCATQPTVGVIREAAPLLRCCRVPNPRASASPFLHQIAVLQHVFGGTESASREGQAWGEWIWREFCEKRTRTYVYTFPCGYCFRASRSATSPTGVRWLVAREGTYIGWSPT